MAEEIQKIEEIDLTPATVLAEDAYIRAVKADGTAVIIKKSDLTVLYYNFNTVNDGDYTILENDGYTDIIISLLTADRTITLPPLSESNNRIIRLWHGENDGGDYKINITAAGTDRWENGTDNSTITVPLMSPGDNITIKADTDRDKWDIQAAHSSWRKAFYSYIGSYSDTNGGTSIKREGFDVFLELNARKNAGWVSGEYALQVDSEFRCPNTITKAFATNANLGAYGIAVLGNNQGANAGKLQIASTNPGGGQSVGASMNWRVL